MMRWLLLAILLVAGLARADTPLALSQTYAGKLNFTGTVASLRTQNDNHVGLRPDQRYPDRRDHRQRQIVLGRLGRRAGQCDHL
jgi:hypothetical protein